MKYFTNWKINTVLALLWPFVVAGFCWCWVVMTFNTGRRYARNTRDWLQDDL